MGILALLPGLLLATGAIAEAGTTDALMYPMHTAVVELSYQSASGVAAIQIRVFQADFGLTVAPASSGAPSDSAIARYVRGALHLTDRAGRTLPLRWVGVEHSGDVMVLRLTAPAPEGLHGARVLSALLCERFEDQVNIVRATSDGRTSTLLFLRGDSAKLLP
jgi:hypothetical protein